MAINLARTAPQREPGSQGEQTALNFLEQSLAELGYQGERQPFSYTDAQGRSKQSANLIVKIPGRGFSLESDYEPGTEAIEELRPPSVIDGRRLYILAHYDSYPGLDPALELEGRSNLGSLNQADGIHDNAAAVAVLLTLAKEAKNTSPGYDLYLVFTGASHDNSAGARALLSSLDDNAKSLTDCVINLSTIYAGDKVYAHAGRNSVLGQNQKSYRLRRKLYELTDIYYNYLLLTNNDFAIYTNQSLVDVTHPELGVVTQYREWTLQNGDHTPFDQAGLPVIFIQSGQYDFNAEETAFKESTDPLFQPSGGRIKGTPYDSSSLLLKHFTAQAQENESDPDSEQAIDRLNRNINNLAFVLLELSFKGPPHCEMN